MKEILLKIINSLLNYFAQGELILIYKIIIVILFSFIVIFIYILIADFDLIKKFLKNRFRR